MTYRQQLRELANESYGYITTRDAADLDIPAVELRKLAARGALQHVSRGVYRFTDARRTHRDAYAEAVIRTGEDAYLTADAVLGLLGLAMVEPQRIKVATPRRTRPKDPGFVEIVQRQLPPEHITTYRGIRATTVGQAILDSQGTVMTERLLDALTEARHAGLIDPREAARIRRHLTATTRKTQPSLTGAAPTKTRTRT
ncbi:MAG: type IV toxin-antitoxin system AbiEi family antitoxin domain-containing protein [Kineosporiaceae bacterium]|nr:type IV toxin-antitoxin system AbiEi family antitoxin domain-containing protein [Kineosporiaceae bacterium]